MNRNPESCGELPSADSNWQRKRRVMQPIDRAQRSPYSGSKKFPHGYGYTEGLLNFKSAESKTQLDSTEREVGEESSRIGIIAPVTTVTLPTDDFHYS